MGARARWAVPAGAVATAGIVIAATAAASAAEPSLPAQSVAQLLADVQQASARPQGPLSATIQETANLGLPALPQIAGITGQSGQLGALSPLAGTTTLSVWYLNPQHVRVAQQVQMGETDLRLDGSQLWLWNSKTQTATHVLLPRTVGNGASPLHPAAGPAGLGTGLSESPLAAARQALAAIGPSTSVGLGPNVTVAGRAAYQIAIAPKGHGSLVSQILIAIDASRHIPLQVEVLAHGSSTPAFEVGFTALTFGPPAQSNFSFTPPSGAKIKTVTVPAKLPAGLGGLPNLGLGSLGGLGGLGGPGGLINGGLINGGPASFAKGAAGAPPVPVPALPKAALKQIRASFLAHLPKNLTKAQRAAAIKAFNAHFAMGRTTAGRVSAGRFSARIAKAHFGIIRMSGSPVPAGASGSPKVLGKDWTSVLVTPASPAVAATVQQLLATRHPGLVPTGSGPFGSSSEQASQATASPAGPGAVTRFSGVPVGPDLAVLRALLMASTPVKGSWGSGRLLQSALVSVLITSKGQILVGAVTPSVLYADAATVSR
jgi:hypothetical protein